SLGDCSSTTAGWTGLGAGPRVIVAVLGAQPVMKALASPRTDARATEGSESLMRRVYGPAYTVAPVDQPSHTPVLLEETLQALQLREGETFVDATAGLGGHASAAAAMLGPGGKVVLNDLDPGNLAAAAERVSAAAGAPVVARIQGSYADLPRALGRRGILADAVLADLGFSSSQMDDPSRGFSIRSDGPLDMRLDPGGPVTAAELVATLPESELKRIFREYGEEPGAGRIARRIVERRREAPIERTGELAELVREAIGPGGGRPGSRRGSIDPATRAFQALRIAVNDELASLRSLLGAVERAAGGIA